MEIKKYINYYKNNPNGYWFKAKLFGWGWTPVKWQGWIVLFFALSIFILSFYIGEAYSSYIICIIGFMLMVLIILIFGYLKGEKPKWQWGNVK